MQRRREVLFVFFPVGSVAEDAPKSGKGEEENRLEHQVEEGRATPS